MRAERVTKRLLPPSLNRAMLRRSIHTLTCWSLVVLLTAVVAMRDGLHLLPGMSHGVVVGNQVVVLGETASHDPGGDSYIRCCILEPAGPRSFDVLDEDECPLCRFFGMKLAAEACESLPWIEVQLPFATCPPLLVQVVACSVYQARAPPLG